MALAEIQDSLIAVPSSSGSPCQDSSHPQQQKHKTQTAKHSQNQLGKRRMCLPTQDESELLLLNIKLTKARQQLTQLKRQRQLQRDTHEFKMESLVQRQVNAARLIASLKKSSKLGLYLQCFQNMCGALSSPYVIRKHAMLCQVLHQDEVLVKQLQLNTKQNKALSTWMGAEADALYEERVQIEASLLGDLHTKASKWNEMEAKFKSIIAEQQEELRGSQVLKEAEDCDASVTSASTTTSSPSLMESVGGFAKGFFRMHSANDEDALTCASSTVDSVASPTLSARTSSAAPMTSGFSLSNLVYRGIRTTDRDRDADRTMGCSPPSIQL